MNRTIKVGFGGSCHWCTEAIFQTLIGVTEVEQGWIGSNVPLDNFSEAVIVHFDSDKIDLKTLIRVHLHTHSCTAEHSMRSKYRSAVYTFSEQHMKDAKAVIAVLQNDFEKSIITQVLPYQKFKRNQEDYLNYYYSNPDKPFCRSYINPKLNKLVKKFSGTVHLK